ncbi:C4-dicarboxylate transporter DctQ subunit [Amorphus suaedae]
MRAVLDRWLGRIVTAAAALAALLMLVCAGSLAYGILVRWLTGASATWPIDMTSHALVYIVMLAAAEAFRRQEHISVDLLTLTLSPRARYVADKWASLAVLATALALVWTGADLVAFSRMIDLHTSDYVALPAYLVQLGMPVGAALLALVALRRLIGPYEEQDSRGNE